MRLDTPLDNFQSEAYLDIALRNWLLKPAPPNPETKSVMAFLAVSLRKNHRDLWLQDFLKAPFSSKGAGLLQQAIQQNYTGNAKQAYLDAARASKEFASRGNTAGVIRSEFEEIYSLGRQANSRECLRKTADLVPPRRYRWLHIQWQIERSICEGIAGHFDIAQRFADLSSQESEVSRYPLLLLRAIALEAAWHNDEGRFREGWAADEHGLKAFWSASYAAERGFQFYSDLALATEKTAQWFLSEALQREVISMIAETNRLDFQAIAHFHLALTAQENGEIDVANREYLRSDAIFASLPNTNVTKYYRADAEIGLIELESQKSLSAARDHLIRIGPAIASAGNFAVSLRYEQAWARIEQRLADPAQEAFHLDRAVEIGNKGYTQLKSEADRWEWDHEVGEAYRRLAQLEITQPHSPERAFIGWERYRFVQNTSHGLPSGKMLFDKAPGRQFQVRSMQMRGTTLLTFAVFPEATVVWVVDHQGIREIQVPISSLVLQKAVQEFRSDCADPNTPMEKVNRAGSRLYQWLLAPVEAVIKSKTTIYVEADQFLSQIPWPALMTPSATYLGQQHTIVQTLGLFYGSSQVKTRYTSTHALIATPSAVTIGTEDYPPLPAALQEKDYVQHLYPDATVLEDKNVTAKHLLQELPKATLFEYAGHARSRPYGGELIIQGESGGDVFSASRLNGLKLTRMELVVLSACSTAASQGEISRDPNGLVRAFLRAGARNVVATGWDVDSATASSLMTHFHQLYRNDHSAPTALKSAQDAVIASGHLHPYYWASFELFGNIN